MRLRFTVHYSHPVERVFPYVAQPERWPEFVQSVVERRRVDDGPPNAGSTWSAVDRVGPFKFGFVEELIEIEDQRQVVWRQTAPWNSLMRFSCTPENNGTRLEVDFEAQPSGMLLPLKLMPTSLLTKTFREDFERIEGLIAGPE